MVFLHEESGQYGVAGTIMDFETIGEFNRKYKDYRAFYNLDPVIFGMINEDHMKIYYIDDVEYLLDLYDVINEELDEIKGKIWAFNKSFEQGIIYTKLHRQVPFLELNSWKYESKRSAEKEYGISNFDDPFFGYGELVLEHFPHNINDCVRHNRACLLKEAEIWKHRFDIEFSFLECK